jgi:hypothetical protein
MITLILALFLLQEKTPSKVAPIEPKATTEADQKRLSQYPNLGGGLYNIDAVPEDTVPQPPVPAAARDPLFRQKKVIENLSKRLDESDALLKDLNSGHGDRAKALKKLSGVFRDIEQDFGKRKGGVTKPAAADPSGLQEVARLVGSMRDRSRQLKPEIFDLQLSDELAELAGSAADWSDALAKAKDRGKP